MDYRSYFTKMGLLLLLVLIPVMVFPHAAGMTTSDRTGAPGKTNCTSCHGDFTLNSGGGSFQLQGIPINYVANSTYSMTLKLNQIGQKRWGFQLKATKGLINVTDATHTYLSNTTFLNQNSAGTYALQTNAVQWSFTWTAPAATVSSITIYAAGNACDNSGDEAGDYVYTLATASLLLAVPPNAGFYGSPTSGVSPLTVNFVDTSVNSPTSWSWSFGDGSTSNLQNPSHVYTTVGVPTSYSVQLIVTNSNGTSTANFNNYIVVTPPVSPIAGFYGVPTSGIGPFNVNFTDTSLNSPTSWAWDFGDGGSSITQNPIHNYGAVSSPTSYSVQLIVANGAGASTTSIANYIYVSPQPPSAGFYGTPTTGQGPLQVNFVDTTANSPTSWVWDFGDGGTSNSQNPSHTYPALAQSTSYNVSLIVSNAYGSSTAIKASYINVSANLTPPPVLTRLPHLKLYIGQPLPFAYDVNDFMTSEVATSYSIISNFLSLGTISGSSVGQLSYSSATGGKNYIKVENVVGSSTAYSHVKYSTYKLAKLPQVVLRPGKSVSVNVAQYASTSSGNALPPSFGSVDALEISDNAVINAVWADSSTITVSALAGFVNSESVNVIAAPVTSGFGQDMDREEIEVLPAISTTAFEFSNAGDTAIFAFQVPGGATGLPTISRVTGVNDLAGKPSNGGALKATFTTTSNGIKITPSFSSWLPNTPGQTYILRVRTFGTNTANNYLQVFYNGNPGKSPTDIQGYFKYSMPTVWTNIDIPISSFSPVSSAPVMYPQVVLKANGGTGSVYIDEMEIFQGDPSIFGSDRYITSDKYIGGYWKDATATSKWSIQTLSGSPTYNVVNSALLINTIGSSTIQNGLKLTASPSSGAIYTAPGHAGKQIGMHMDTRLVSGPSNTSLTQVQMNLLGTKGPGLFAQGGDIGAAAEIGRVSDRTMELAFYAAVSDYQVQFIVKNVGGSTIEISNTQANIDNDDPNYGDETLFP